MQSEYSFVLINFPCIYSPPCYLDGGAHRKSTMDRLIEIAVPNSASTTVKGDLLEELAKDLLQAQGYTVTTKLRITGAELDLLCNHKVNGKQIYVECKAYRSNIDAPTLRQLWGTVDCNEYSEGWLISTADFGKDARGFVHEWKKKSKEKSQRMSFYTPDVVLDSLESANVIVKDPKEKAIETFGDVDRIGASVLIVSPFGRHWAIFILNGGVADSALIYSAKTGNLVTDDAILKNFHTLDSSVNLCDLSVYKKYIAPSHQIASISEVTSVVEIQTGDSWDDYRPARPKDFIGRKEYLSEIFGFLSDIQAEITTTRIFSITGNSGLGKSSLIAQLRQKSRNKRNQNKFYVFAVDVRGARGPSYIMASLLAALKAAQSAGFGCDISLKIDNPESPLSSDSISQYLESLKASDKVICLVFDQFEELYSKPELFPVFEAAKNLMFDVAGKKGNLCLGFAWKSDFTSQGDHPAYHMWHSLNDYRKNYKLDIFNSAEISASLTLFEKQINQKIKSDLRHQISTSCQGFPWLLKKLCINLYDGIQKSGNQGVFNGTLDVGKLFQSDVEQLTSSERTCLTLIAEKAPADWSEIIDIAGVSALNGLLHRRLVVRSGDRLNVYWDIFKDYLISGKTPSLSFNYIPTNEFYSVTKLAKSLIKDTAVSAADLSHSVALSERTILNIGADLVMFGIAERDTNGFKLAQGMKEATESEVLLKLRERFDLHSVKIELYKNPTGSIIDIDGITEALKVLLPKANHDSRTWSTYAKRLARFLSLVGYLVPKGKSWIIRDLGRPVSSSTISQRGTRTGGALFAPLSSPIHTIEGLSGIGSEGVNLESDYSKEHRNSIAILRRFQLILVSGRMISVNHAAVERAGGAAEAIWSAAKNEETLIKCLRFLEEHPEASAKEVGAYISKVGNLSWVDATTVRYGNVLRQWAKWLAEGIDKVKIPARLLNSTT